MAQEAPAKSAEDNGEAEGAKKRRQRNKKPNTDEQAAEEGADENKGEKKQDRKEKEKTHVYVSPMDFKEKRKFKSKWEEYRHGDWRKQRSNTYVTLETVIPELPSKPLSPPDEETYKKKLKELEDKIKDIGSTLDEKKVQFDEILSAKIAS